MKIYTPVKDFNGLRNNIRFVNGIGETDNPALIDWFRVHGYDVCEAVNTKPDKPIETNEANKINESNKTETLDFDSMTPNDLRDWMRANGYGAKIRNTRSKDKLLAILKEG